MTLKPFIVTGFIVAGAAAAAQEGTQDFKDVTLSSRTRTEVLADLHAARARGQLDQLGETYGSVDPRSIRSTRSRAEVVAELEATRVAGRLDDRGETYGSFDARSIGSSRTRAEVVAEMLEAVKTRRPLSRGERS